MQFSLHLILRSDRKRVAFVASLFKDRWRTSNKEATKTTLSLLLLNIRYNKNCMNSEECQMFDIKNGLNMNKNIRNIF